MIRNATVFAGLTVVSAAALLSCSSNGSAVAMGDGLDFDPSEITVTAGETITFSNTSSVVHTVTAYEDSIPEGGQYFASGGFEDEQTARDDIEGGFIEPGDQFEVTLDAPGSYRYFCIPHEGVDMVGTIVVEE